MKKPQWWLIGITAAFLCVLLGIFIGRNYLSGTNLNIQDGQTPSTSPTGQSEPLGDGKIDINNATIVQLDMLPGIGEVIAQRIIDYREENGPFTKIEDIKNVSGIGDKKFEQIKEYIKVDNGNENSGS